MDAGEIEGKRHNACRLLTQQPFIISSWVISGLAMHYIVPEIKRAGRGRTTT